jgi:hypothetical protein
MAQMAFAEHHDMVEAFPCGSSRSTVLRMRFARVNAETSGGLECRSIEPIDGVPEDLVAGLMETAERDFRRGFAQESVVAEKANDDDIAAENDKFKP